LKQIVNISNINKNTEARKKKYMCCATDWIDMDVKLMTINFPELPADTGRPLL